MAKGFWKKSKSLQKYFVFQIGSILFVHPVLEIVVWEIFLPVVKIGKNWVLSISVKENFLQYLSHSIGKASGIFILKIDEQCWEIYLLGIKVYEGGVMTVNLSQLLLELAASACLAGLGSTAPLGNMRLSFWFSMHLDVYF